MSNVDYFGTRTPIVESLKKYEGLKEKNFRHLQVIDLGGAEPPSLKYLLKNIDKNIPTVILSVRRYNIQDELGEKEALLLEKISNSIIYRVAPLDANFEFYRGWAGATGSILTALDPRGVAWVNTLDLAEAILIPENDILERSGNAYDIIGPRLISMKELKANFEKLLDTEIELKHLTKEDAKKTLSKNHVPEHIIDWLVNFEVTATDHRLENTSYILEKIIGKSAREPDFNYLS